MTTKRPPAQPPADVDFEALDETARHSCQARKLKRSRSASWATQTFESLETFFVNLSNPQGLVLADDQAIGRIANDDSPTPILSFADVETQEGIAGEKPSVTFELKLSSPPADEVTVDFATADGTARASELDYLAQNGTIVFLPGQQKAFVTVTVLGDFDVETNETFLPEPG